MFKNNYYKCKAAHINSDICPAFDVELVGKSIDKIANNKAAGCDKITIEFLKFAHPSLIVILSKLFNIYMTSGIVPDDFGVGVTTPIPKFKGRKNISEADDYRGITINVVISKIFEYCLLDMFTDINTSDRQFGFKKGLSCNHSIHTVRRL